MYTYLIQQKIHTLSQFNFMDFFEQNELKFCIDGVTFRPWYFDNETYSTDPDWVAESLIQATDFSSAHEKFLDKLRSIVPIIGFVTHGYMNFRYESHMIYRQDDNPDKNVVVYHLTNRNGVGLMFNKSDLTSVLKLKNHSRKHAFRFIQEAINTSNFYARLMLFFAAIEALSGEEEFTDPCTKQKRKSYNKKEAKLILSNDLYEEVFGKGGVRHKLTHGGLENFQMKDYVGRIYTALVSYFNTNHGTSLNTLAREIPRDLHGNKNRAIIWLQIPDPDLRTIVELISSLSHPLIKGQVLGGLKITHQISGY